jgi:hypothetical protein
MSDREAREEARRRQKESRKKITASTRGASVSIADMILEWATERDKAELSKKFRASACIICARRGIKPAGRGTLFLRNEDGGYVYRCGNDPPKHEDIVISVPLLMDTHTLTQEIRPTQRETIRELKVIRDSVLARNVIDDEDKERFETLETMSRHLTKIEETYTEAIHRRPLEYHTYVYEEDPVSELLKEPQFNTKQIRGQDGKILQKVKPIVFGVVSPEEIPVKMN